MLVAPSVAARRVRAVSACFSFFRRNYVCLRGMSDTVLCAAVRGLRLYVLSHVATVFFLTSTRRKFCSVA